MRSNYLVKFIVLGITFYGLQTLQGPSQAIRAFSTLVHYTDWVPGHGAHGNDGMGHDDDIRGFYYMIPRIYNTEVYSVQACERAFLARAGWTAHLLRNMWITGIRQGGHVAGHGQGREPVVRKFHSDPDSQLSFLEHENSGRDHILCRVPGIWFITSSRRSRMPPHVQKA